MNSEVLNKLGLGSVDPFIFIAILLGIILVLVLWNVLQSIKIKNIEENYETFFVGNEETSLSESMEHCFERMGFLIKTNRERNRLCEELFQGIGKCYQKTAIVKYDALHEMGGQLSFALAMLNHENCGYVFNVVNSNQGCYVYAKSIVNGVSEGPLSEEEEEAFGRAMEQDHLKKYETLMRKQKKQDGEM
ncbi:MAG: DUF4446 family protein [Lachnospiraceae bacterium]|nr:DUF4446 family protein [Lachnospiraceae bacterium]